jgi:flagellar assembly protein FliH
MKRWDLPSFDAAPETATSPNLDEVQNIRAKAHQEGFARGLQDGIAEGRAQGIELGRQEGLELGRQEGFQAGHQQGYESGVAEVQQHLSSLSKVLSTLNDLPQDIESALTDWVFETAVRLSGQATLDRAVFAAAVQEALMRLPRPGEQMFVRVGPSEVPIWTRLIEDQAFHAVLQVDPELQPGQAYVEVAGTVLDLSEQARRALVKNALGLLDSSSAPSR